MDKQKIKKFIIANFKTLFFVGVLFLFYTAPSLASPVQDGLDTAAGTAFEKSPTDPGSGLITNIPEAIGKILGSILQFIGAFFLILTIYGGFTWMLARGNDQEVTKAKDIIEAALIGLIIVLAAYVITSFVGNLLIG